MRRRASSRGRSGNTPSPSSRIRSARSRFLLNHVSSMCRAPASSEFWTSSAIALRGSDWLRASRRIRSNASCGRRRTRLVLRVLVGGAMARRFYVAPPTAARAAGADSRRAAGKRRQRSGGRLGSLDKSSLLLAERAWRLAEPAPVSWVPRRGACRATRDPRTSPRYSKGIESFDARARQPPRLHRAKRPPGHISYTARLLHGRRVVTWPLCVPRWGGRGMRVQARGRLRPRHAAGGSPPRQRHPNGEKTGTPARCAAEHRSSARSARCSCAADRSTALPGNVASASGSDAS